MQVYIEIVRHELNVALRTKRMLLVSLVYVAAAILGAFAYSMALREIEKVAVEAMAENGLDPFQAQAALILTSQEAYTRMTEFLSGVAVADLSAAMQESAAVPVYFWASLTFLPFLVAITSFDVLQNDLQHRTLCFSTLRASRRTILLAKFTAHLAILSVVSALAATAFVAMTVSLVSSVSLGDTVIGMVRVWTLLIPFGAAYLALATMASTLTKRAALALAIAVAGALVLRVFFWLGFIPETSQWYPLSYLERLSPIRFHEEFWRSGFLSPMLGVLIFAVYTTVFLAVADLRLRRRDL